MGYESSKNPRVNTFMDKARASDASAKRAIALLELGQMTKLCAYAQELGAPISREDARAFLDSYLVKKPAVLAFLLYALANGTKKARIDSLANTRKPTEYRALGSEWGLQMTTAEADFVRRTYKGSERVVTQELRDFVRVACSDQSHIDKTIDAIKLGSVHVVVDLSREWKAELSDLGAQILIKAYEEDFRIEDILVYKKIIS